MPKEWGSINVTTRDARHEACLIENGILKNYMIDRLNGRRMGMPVTGSARRKVITFAHLPHAQHLIAAASHDEKEIIQPAANGLYANPWRRSVNPVTGEI